MINDVNSSSSKVNLCDYLIINSDIYDGSGTAVIKQDIAITGDKIVAIGDLKDLTAKKVIDGKGLALAPGFIDVHTHDDLEVIRNPSMPNKISQGVTSVVIGNCGISASPYQSANPPIDPVNLLGHASEFIFPSLQDFVKQYNQVQPSINVAALVGHTSLRAQVMDDLNRPATAKEIMTMMELFKQALAHGAKGLSTGLAYENAQAASSAEISALVEQIKEFGGIYCTHIRTEFDGIIDALDEAFFTAKQAEVPVVISHLKCAGKNNWGRADEVIAHIEKHQKAQKIGCDCYPYHASSSTLDLQQVTEDFDILITWSDPHPEKAKQTLAAIAKQWQVSLQDAALRLQPAGAVYHGMNEDDVRKFITFPHSMIGSDGLPCDPHPHPRLWGTFPRVLGRYCRDEKLLSLSKAIHKMTGLSAREFKLKQRGFIRVGHYADIVLFNADTIADLADFSHPVTLSKGIEYVWVNGQLSYQAGRSDKQMFGKNKGAGRFLKHEVVSPND
ncbi:N-acyl-D-amino-acid deacylase family protein [Thalassotalea atypica]|uniref:N-acyl-D-amino-acid deacylase family protein n=1 Tax=Thalassotalea atypica TaxID=2054316 RepID=UPI0025734BB0|nr:D-aminoacylase [Thalassotalea atypica]